MDWKAPFVIGLSLVASAAWSQDAAQPSPSALITRMLSFYSNAQTLTGNIRFTQTAQNTSVTIETVLQVERPSRLYIRQVLRSSEPATWLVVSDGKEFSYNTPSNLPGHVNLPRLVEKVSQNGETLDTRSIYKAGVTSIGDRSAPLDIAIGHPDDLKSLTYQWATLEYRGRRKLGDEEVDVIGGRWRPYGQAPANGEFEMYMLPTGELRRYAILESVSPQGANGAVFEVRSIWDVQIKVNGKPDPTLFRVVR